jgi:hypothetical protein
MVCGESEKLSDGTLNAHPPKRPVEPHPGRIQFARKPIGRRWTFNRPPRAGGAGANRSPSSGQPNNERANLVRETGNGTGTIGESMQTPANPTKPTSYSVNWIVICGSLPRRQVWSSWGMHKRMTLPCHTG